MINVRDNGKIADVCAVHEGGLTLHFSISPETIIACYRRSDYAIDSGDTA